jgi:hypothetical protein
MILYQKINDISYVCLMGIACVRRLDPGSLGRRWKQPTKIFQNQLSCTRNSMFTNNETSKISKFTHLQTPDEKMSNESAFLHRIFNFTKHWQCPVRVNCSLLIVHFSRKPSSVSSGTSWYKVGKIVSITFGPEKKQ